MCSHFLGLSTKSDLVEIDFRMRLFHMFLNPELLPVANIALVHRTVEVAEKSQSIRNFAENALSNPFPILLPLK